MRRAWAPVKSLEGIRALLASRGHGRMRCRRSLSRFYLFIFNVQRVMSSSDVGMASPWQGCEEGGFPSCSQTPVAPLVSCQAAVSLSGFYPEQGLSFLWQITRAALDSPGPPVLKNWQPWILKSHRASMTAPYMSAPGPSVLLTLQCGHI